jgi:CCR4-NOT transcriptional complex subunit CAF120
MVQTFQPPLMDVGDDTPPELQPIFTFLNSHSNKLYQEGYFLKLDDQNTRRFMSPLRASTLALTMLLQMGDPTQTEHGRNALRSL